MIKAMLMNPDVYCWAYFPSCRVCCTDSAGRMLLCYLPAAPSCVCVCVPAVKVWDVKWLTTVGTSLGTCVDRWPSGCTGWWWGYGTAVQGALLGSAACQCDVFPYGCLILSVFYWTRVAQENSQCSFWKVWLNSTCGASFSFSLSVSLSLSCSDALISAFSHSLQFLHLGRFEPSLLGR